MFHEPEVIESKAAIKADHSAPARSAIRRTVRYNPQVRDHPPTSRSRSYGRSRDADRRSLLEIIRRDHGTAAATNSPSTSRVEAEADVARAEASNRRRQESGRALLRDALSYERPGQLMRIPRESSTRYDMAPPLPPVPEPRHYPRRGPNSSFSGLETVSSLARPEERRSPPPDYRPTPPYTSGNTSSGSSPHSPTPPLGAASLTPMFAPAYRIEESTAATSRYQENAMRYTMNRPNVSDLDELPLLHRMESRSYPRSLRRTRELAPQDLVDGLGDRRRSFSPDDNSWDTLLTTIAPDERLPSAHSSFTSATASASSLSSNSASSSDTLLTVPTSSSYTMEYPTICENTDDEGSESEDERYLMLQGSAPEGPPARDPNGLSSSSHRRTAQQIINRADQLVREGQRLDREEELQQIHANLDSLERQLPREWWAPTDALGRNAIGRNPMGPTRRERL
ncbi:hypothetical protein MMC12_001737 [Toensbergia leucococca]|nr:hypothetical protein [Toensbergia leucococca]